MQRPISSEMELPKSSSAPSSEMQRPIFMHSSMPSNYKIQQDEDEADPRLTDLLKTKLFCFWEETLCSDLKRRNELPVSRIKRAMKSKGQAKMVSAHSTVLLGKATEMFILELTFRAWMQADQVKRRTLKRCDFARAIRNEELLDFLSDIVPLQTYEFQVEQEANNSPEFYPAYQTVQPNNVPYQFQVEEAHDVHGKKFRPAYPLVQPNNIPFQFQVEQEANDGQGNEFGPTYEIVQPHNIPVEQEANAYQGIEFDWAYQMFQPSNTPASFISTQGIPAPLMLPPANNSAPEGEFTSDGFALDNKEGV